MWVFVARNNFEKVVIKKLLGEDEKEKSLFLKEAKILHVIKSEHKVKFKAVCMELFATMLEYLFFDFAPFGGSEVVSSLDQFLWQFFFTIFYKWTNEQHSANSSCKNSLFSDAFRLTVAQFFRKFYKLKLNACIYEP